MTIVCLHFQTYLTTTYNLSNIPLNSLEIQHCSVIFIRKKTSNRIILVIQGVKELKHAEKKVSQQKNVSTITIIKIGWREKKER